MIIKYAINVVVVLAILLGASTAGATLHYEKAGDLAWLPIHASAVARQEVTASGEREVSTGQLPEADFYEEYFYILVAGLSVACVLVSYIIVKMVQKVRKARRLLRKERNRLAILMDAGQFEGFEIDVNSNTVTRLSPFGVALSTHTIEEELAMIHPKDRKMVEHNIENARNGEDIYGAIVVRIKSQKANARRGDEYRYYSLFSKELQESDGSTKLYWVKRDINDTYSNNMELARYHERMDMALKNTGIAQWDYDVVSRTITVRNGNKAPKVVTVDADTYVEHLPSMKPILEIMDKGEVTEFSRDVTYSYAGLSETRYATVMARAMSRGDDGKVTLYTGIRKDNTSLIKIQIDLEQAKKKAEEADRLKSQFLDNMSHEIRTPLNAIVGFSSLLQDASPDERTQYVEIINKGAEQLLTIVEDILDMSSIEAGTLELSPSTFDFAITFDSIACKMERLMTTPDVKLIVDNPYRSCVITFDEKRIGQIVKIFVTNAIKNTRKGYVKMGYRYAEGTGLTITVEDTGIGISKENYGHVFKRFEKIDNFAQGSGLELAIVKAFADHTGNEVGFTSCEGRGSIFYFVVHCTASVEERGSGVMPL